MHDDDIVTLTLRRETAEMMWNAAPEPVRLGLTGQWTQEVFRELQRVLGKDATGSN
jgi:hypothetical protein